MVISLFLVRRLLPAVPLLFSLVFVACGPDAAPPTAPVSGTPRPTAKTESQAELVKAFDDSTSTLLEIKTAEQFSQIKANEQAILTPGVDGLEVKATGGDPALFLPPFAAGKQFILKVVIESPMETGMQLFYALRDAPNYNEINSQMYPLIKGKNVVYFQVGQPDLIDPVRLDPSYNAGDYKIESIVAREVVKRPAP
jgi:hypothetical protein